MADDDLLEAIRAILRRSGGIHLAPPLAEAAIERFERRHGVVLPSGYRRFLLEIGNGGDGPGHGLEAFDAEAELSNLDAPFPLTAVWIWDDDPHPDPLAIEACRRGWMKVGTEGCGMDWVVVVSGPERGRVWNVEDQGAQPCTPGRDFLEWYALWLRWKEAGEEASGASWWDTVWADHADA